MIERDGLIMVQSRVARFNVAMSVYYFYIDGLLIDTGPSRLSRDFIQFFNSRKVEQAVFTHHHEDHTGMAAWLQKHTDIPLYLHKTGHPQAEMDARLPLYRRIFWGQRKAFRPQDMPEKIETEHHLFDIIHTPGHAHDHVALLERENGRLFSGDLYLTSHPKSMFAFESVPQMVKSIQTVLEYDFEELICSHSGFIADGKGVLREKLNYLTAIEEEVKGLYEQGVPPRQIKKRLFPKIYPLNVVSLFENSPYHMVRSITEGLKKGY